MTLEETLDSVKKEINTDSYPMSIGELATMYTQGEIVLQPEYQRGLKWTKAQKTKLIESILIGLPLPQFFMGQDESGNLEVVDGLQRCSTILAFMGLLGGEDATSFESLSDDLTYLKDFAGVTWGGLPRRIQLDFKRTKIQITILLRYKHDDEKHTNAKLELFNRLNMGGTAMTDGELAKASEVLQEKA